MFYSNRILTLATLVITVTIPSAHALQKGAVYAAKAGDCLSAIVKAHYSNTTGHFFVLHSNPGIVDENRIEVGQEIVLPGLMADQVLSNVDQTGCNAASLAARHAAKSSITEKAGVVAGQRVSQQPAVAKAEAKPADRKPRPSGTEGKTISEAKELPTTPAPLARTPQKKASDKVPVHPPASAGTQALPIDDTQRTVAVTARGRPTQAAAPMPSKPLFAVDDAQTAPSYSYRPSTPNRYVVNAIGARTLTAANALVQHPDQRFYVESRADWQNGMSGHVLDRSNTTPTPTSDPSSKTSNPLEEALAQTKEPKTQSAGNIFIDESLLRKAAAQPGGNP